MKEIKLIHVVPSLNVISSGLDIAAVRLAIEQIDRGMDIKIFPLKAASSKLYGNYSAIKDRLIGFRLFLRLLKEEDLFIQFHGIWYTFYIFLAFFCVLYKKKYFVTPHGALEPYALQKSTRKKSLYTKYIARYLFKYSSGCIVASHKEYKSVKIIFPDQKIINLPIGIEVPLENIPKFESDLKYILYIGRISPEKGIDLLVRSLSLTKNQSIVLKVIGPESDYSDSVRKMVGRLGLSSRILFMGELYGVEKYSVLKSAQLLVLPSFTENFGLVVPEALSYGVPVLTTTGTPWANLSLAQGCMIVKPELIEISLAIDDFLRMKKEDIIEVKISAKKTAAQYYWKEIDVLGYMISDYA